MKHSSHSKLFALAMVGVFGLSSLALASGDRYRLGGTRADSMGGAGLALPFDVTQNFRLNPAMLGLKKSGFGFQAPTIGAYSTGYSFKKISDTVSDNLSASDTAGSATKVARQLGGKDFDLGADASLGFVVGNIGITGGGEALLSSRPNDALKTYIANNPNGDFTGLSGGERLDAYGFGYYSVGVSGGVPVPVSTGSLTLGGQLKQVTGYYAHKFADQNTISTNGDAVNGSEIGSGDSVKKTGIGFDFGGLYKVPAPIPLYTGLTVDNLIRPNMNFRRTDGAGLPMADLRPLQTSLSIGAGAQLPGGMLVAADIHDVTGSAGGKELRMGAEWQVGKIFALRAGYNSRNAASVGVSVAGFNLTLGGRAPLTISSLVRF